MVLVILCAADFTDIKHDRYSFQWLLTFCIDLLFEEQCVLYACISLSKKSKSASHERESILPISSLLSEISDTNRMSDKSTLGM